MSRGINKVILLGNVGQDPVLRVSPNGINVANITLATTDQWRDKQTGDKSEDTEWHRVVFFKKLADVVQNYVSKGSKLYVEGFLRTRKWSDKEGKTNYSTEIVGRELILLGGKSSEISYESAKSGTPTVDDSFDDDIPF